MIDNILVPKHEVLSPEDAEKLLAKYGVTREDMPKILKSDPSLVKFKPAAGSIIKITRYTAEIGYSAYYRVVVEG